MFLPKQQRVIGLLSTISQFLNLEIDYDRDKQVMKISQRGYINQTLEHFDMKNENYKKFSIPDGAVLYQSIGKPLENATEYISIVERQIYLSNG